MILSVEILANFWDAFSIKGAFPLLSIDRAANPQVHISARKLEAKPKRIWVFQTQYSSIMYSVSLAYAWSISFIHLIGRVIPLVFLYPFHHSLLFFSPSTPPSEPGQWNTLRCSRGQAALDEEEEEEAGAGRCYGCEGRPLSQVYDQSQVHRRLHSQYVWERSGRHHGHWPGKGQHVIQTLNWGSISINDCVQNTPMPVIDYLSWNIWNIPKILGQICTRELGGTSISDCCFQHILRHWRPDEV